MKPACRSTKSRHDAGEHLTARQVRIIRHGAAACARAFTLVEIVIAMTIVAVLAAATMPMMKGFQEERVAREPVTALLKLAREARMRAMKEKRPYQVAFHATGFTASRYFNPYLQLTELNEFLEAGETEPAVVSTIDEGDKTDLDNGGRSNKTTELPLAPPAPKYDEHWSEAYELPKEVKYQIQHWYDAEPTPIEGDLVKLWVFQPSGVCQPLKIHVEGPSSTFDVEFAALTADIVRESVDLR
ncbi:MAG: type II secretion system GspH family protein [Prosthecobacter sp.]|uniref:pilus assembly FimT family protein n=1 Tax=Prosthecobacter sp. TaxID=1965333 RepID=UPI0025DA4B29|nr:type II secretion system protein [Prosthecobacter sp.]MCF7787532.1 type II secretion system GspH family protein [Prosthecobacter sp.]